MRTYDVQITNMRIMKACFWRAKQGLSPAPPLKGFNLTRNLYVFSVRITCVDRAVLWCATNAIRHVIEATELGRDARRDGENCQNHQIRDKLRCSYSRQPDVFAELLPSWHNLLIKLSGRSYKREHRASSGRPRERLPPTWRITLETSA